MRKLIYAALALCLAMTGCTLETSGNDDLDGFWQLSQLDTIANGTTVDMRESGIYWAVQMNLLRTSKVDGHAYFFRFVNTGDSLLLSEPYRDLRDSSDIKISDAALLAPYGVNSLTQGYAILSLDADKMTLQSETLRLYFRKY